MRLRFPVRLAAVAALVAQLAIPAAGENPPLPESTGLEVRVFTIHHRSVDDASVLVRDHLGPRGAYTIHPSLRTITVEDDRAALEAIGRVLAAFDIAPPEVLLTIQLLRATERSRPEASLQEEIRGVERSLRDLTRWNQFDRVGSVALRVAEGASVEAELPRTPYRVELGVDYVQRGGRIRLAPFRLLRERAGEGGEETTLRVVGFTGLNLTDSRLFTIGATQAERSPEALFVTITARVED